MATKYLVLRKTGEAEFTLLHMEVEANGGQSAIRQSAAEALRPEGEWVAVPTSNWTQEFVTVESRDPIIRVGGVAGQVTLDEALAEKDGD